MHIYIYPCFITNYKIQNVFKLLIKFLIRLSNFLMRLPYNLFGFVEKLKNKSKIDVWIYLRIISLD